MAFHDPAAAEAAFYDAFRQLDLDAMGTVWKGDDDCHCVHPGGGMLSGARDILESWSDIFHGSNKPSIEVRVIDTTVSDDLAIHLVEERIGSSPDPETTGRVLSTNIYQRTEHGWRMRVHHASLPLVEKLQGERPPLH